MVVMLPGDPFDLTGEVLDGQYRVQSVVRPAASALAGQAGEPIVIYRGDHMGVPIAIECLRLPSDIDADAIPKAVETFLEGGRLHHRLARGHPAIVQSIAVGSRLAPRTGMIVPYLVREWLEGEPLAEELARPLTVRRIGRDLGETMALFEPAIEALGYAHAQSAAHLALGPRTLFLEARGDTKQLKILDFGIARAIDTTLKSRRAPPEYTAPELQERGGPEPGPAADVYAIARILRDVLSGVDLPRNMELALSRAAERIPDRRPKDASRLWEEMSASIRAPAVSGAVPSKRAVSAPSIGARTVPMSFEASSTPPSEPPPPNPSDPPPVHVISRPPPAHFEAALPAVIVEGRASASKPSAERTVMIEAVVMARSRKRTRALTLGAVLLLLATGGAVFIFGAVRRHRAQATIAANIAPPAPVLPAPALAGQASASADLADAAAATAEASAPPLTALAHFTKGDAKAALDTTAKDVARCKKGKGWGAASATVSFGNDGSVTHVIVGPPFGGTGTGACVSEALQTARMPPFGGKAGTLVYRFFVAPH
jgi:serine/threonine-protein kinase